MGDSAGSAPGCFRRPHGVAVAPDGYVYVADTRNNRVQRFSSDGQLLAVSSSAGVGEGQLNRSIGLDVGPRGNIYVCDTGNDRMQKFSGNGSFVTAWKIEDGKQRHALVDCCVDREGFVYVADAVNDHVHKFTGDGVYVLSIGERGSGDGEFLTPHAPGVSPDGVLYVSDEFDHRIQIFNSNGTFLGAFGSGPGEFYAPMGVAADGSGNIYVADSTNYRVQRWRAVRPGN
jgi:DNA-binding beta-propeller fold protein YncE